MVILCIDPGPKESAYVVWNTVGHNFENDLGGIENKGLVSTEGMIGRLQRLYYMVNMVAMEMVQSYGQAVGRETFATALNVGRFTQALFDKGSSTPIKYYARPTIKGQVGGRTDSEVNRAIRLRYGNAKKGELLEGVKHDIWSALAIAIALEENPNLKEWRIE